MDLSFLPVLIFFVFIIVIYVKEFVKGAKKYYENKQKYYKPKKQQKSSGKELIKELITDLLICINFLFWGSIVLIIVGAYVIAIFKWFNTSHIYFWTGFKELIWALMPILNIFYILK